MSEFRQDVVSGDWIIVAPERAKRPHDFLPKKKIRKFPPRSQCVFEDLKKSGNWPPVFAVPSEKNWNIAVIPNKYPALRHYTACPTMVRQGPYNALSNAGHHDLVITRDHKKNFAHLNPREATAVLSAFQRRHRELLRDRCMQYVSTFFNWGASAGASIYHPHFQMLTLPIIPPDVKRSLDGSMRYFRKHRSCVHCDMLRYECKMGKRIIYENAAAVVLAPFVSKAPFEVRVYPKAHESRFEMSQSRRLPLVAHALQAALLKIEKHLNDPDLNFFIHTAPLKASLYRHYHWHIEINPKITIPAGFELGTGVDIDIIDPDRAARILRGGRDARC